MRRLLTCLVLVLLANPAVACINDSELPTHEREFRSKYRGTQNPPTPSTAPANNNNLLYGGGAVLLTGALALAVTGRRLKG